LLRTIIGDDPLGAAEEAKILESANSSKLRNG